MCGFRNKLIERCRLHSLSTQFEIVNYFSSLLSVCVRVVHWCTLAIEVSGLARCRFNWKTFCLADNRVNLLCATKYCTRNVSPYTAYLLIVLPFKRRPHWTPFVRSFVRVLFPPILLFCPRKYAGVHCPGDFIVSKHWIFCILFLHSILSVENSRTKFIIFEIKSA